MNLKSHNIYGFDYPQNYIDETVCQLEQAQTLGIELELSQTCLHPAVYNVEFATRESVRRASAKIALRATALYAYARFDDETLSCSSKFPRTKFEHYPQGLLNTLKHRAEQKWNKINTAVRRQTYKRLKRSLSLPGFPRRLRARLATREIVTREDEQIYIERIQESLLAQIALLYKYNLVPQAVLAHPKMAGCLVAAAALPNYQSVSIHSGSLMFAGLPVIVCQELAQGAIVV